MAATSESGNLFENEVADLWILETVAYKTVSLFLSDKNCAPCLQRMLCVWKHFLALHPNQLLSKTHYIVLGTILQSYETNKEQGLLQLLKEIESTQLDVKQQVKEDVMKFLQTKIVLCYYERGNIRRARRYFRDKEKSTLYPDQLNHLLNNTESTFPDELGVKNLQKHLIPLVSEFLKKIGTPKLYQLISSLLKEKEKQEAVPKNNDAQQESTNQKQSPAKSLRAARQRQTSASQDNQNDRASQDEPEYENESQSILPTRRCVKTTPRRRRRTTGQTEEESTDDEMSLSRTKPTLRKSSDETGEASDGESDGTSQTNVKELRSRNVEIQSSTENKSTHDNKATDDRVQPSPRKPKNKSPLKKDKKGDKAAEQTSKDPIQRKQTDSETDVDITLQTSVRELRSRNVDITPSKEENSTHNNKRNEKKGGSENDVRKSPRKSPVKKLDQNTEQPDQTSDDGSVPSSHEHSQKVTSKKPFAAVQPVRSTYFSHTSKSLHRKKKGKLRARPSESILEIATSDNLEATRSKDRAGEEDNDMDEPSTSKKHAEVDDDRGKRAKDFYSSKKRLDDASPSKKRMYGDGDNRKRAGEPSTSKKRAVEEDSYGRKKKKKGIVNASEDEGESLKWSDDDEDDDDSSVSGDERSKFSMRMRISLNSTVNRKRIKFTAEEEEYLRRGIKRYGVGRWADILNHYKFHASRTNVSLKDKYRTMKKQGHF